MSKSKSPIYREQFNAAYNTQFNIPEYLQADLDIYKRLNWQASYFLAQWESNIDTYAAGTIRKYNHIFHVNFCSGCSLGKIKNLIANGHNPQLILSFRKYGKYPAIVLVDFLRIQSCEYDFDESELADLEITGTDILEGKA